jgi:hypothetical protein
LIACSYRWLILSLRLIYLFLSFSYVICYNQFNGLVVYAGRRESHILELLMMHRAQT